MKWDLLVGNIILYIATMLCLMFLVMFPVLVKDSYRTPVGRAIFYLIFVLFGVLATVAAVNIFGPSYPWRAGLRLFFFAQVPIAIGNLIRLLFSLQIEGYRERYTADYIVKLSKENKDES